MKTKILSGLLCCLGIFAANAQTITAPTGQSLTITNPIDVTGGGINILTDAEYKIGGKKVISNKGAENIFLGENTGITNSSGTQNSFIGANAGLSNTTGNLNLFLGSNAGRTNTAGINNAFIGANSGFSNTIGNYNVFLGAGAGYLNTTGTNNSFIGTAAGISNTTGVSNVFIGANAGFSNSSGGNNLCLGAGAGYNNTTGNFNAFIGTSAGISNTTGINNIFVGPNSGFLNTVGGDNLFLGLAAGYSNLNGNHNIFLGTLTGNTNTSGSDNTYIGYGILGSSSISNATVIGSGATAAASNTVVLGNAATTITGQGLAAGASGLKFANLKSSSAPTVVGGNKVLSVNSTGDVVLVELTSGTINGTNPVAESTWKNQDGYLYNNSTNGVVINGTGLDGNALIVKGGVLSKEVNVKVEGAESWPDYVFKPTYKRMSLEEVEKFISINGHLPNVASATEMAATGNNLNKTDIKLLEKVEELTLYLLEMKKANDAQSAEIQALKKQMSKLRKK